ncbi:MULTISPECIES: hypothetical protein [Deefgea]|uniref:Uncharacterized protein n=1 Tax=Deefgea chitinilytica TaxID=570276 RepID=A0ABS2CAB2_9NEIS|nr:MULTISPECIES: hypothetical protein [Deefgea]MBM5571078.1 hypothetical protein [Deefgea chitinilytica]MBM9888308.1 hypothetical protein [Deefgea sp. CFH1-16]
MDFEPNEFKEFVQLGIDVTVDFYPSLIALGFTFKRLSFNNIPDDSCLNWQGVIKRAKGARDVAAYGVFHPANVKAVYAFQVAYKNEAVLLSHVERFENCPLEAKCLLGANFALAVTKTTHSLIQNVSEASISIGVKDPLPELHAMYLKFGQDAYFDADSNTIFYRGGL